MYLLVREANDVGRCRILISRSKFLWVPCIASSFAILAWIFSKQLSDAICCITCCSPPTCLIHLTIVVTSHLMPYLMSHILSHYAEETVQHQFLVHIVDVCRLTSLVNKTTVLIYSLLAIIMLTIPALMNDNTIVKVLVLI